MSGTLPTHSKAKLIALLNAAGDDWQNYINTAIADQLHMGEPGVQDYGEEYVKLYNLIDKLPEETQEHLSELIAQNQAEYARTQIELLVFKLAFEGQLMYDITKNQTLTSARSKQLLKLQQTGINPKVLALTIDIPTQTLTNTTTLNHLKQLADQPLDTQLAYMWCRRNKIAANKALNLALNENTKTILSLPGSILKDEELTEEILKTPIDNKTRTALSDPKMKKTYYLDDTDIGSITANAILATQSIDSHLLLPKLAKMHRNVQTLPDKTIERTLKNPRTGDLFNLLENPEFNRENLEKLLNWLESTTANIPNAPETINIGNLLQQAADAIDIDTKIEEKTYTLPKMFNQTLGYTHRNYYLSILYHDVFSALKNSTNPAQDTTVLTSKTPEVAPLNTLIVKQILKKHIENLQTLQRKTPGELPEQLKTLAWEQTVGSLTTINSTDMTLYSELIVPALQDGGRGITQKTREQLDEVALIPKNLTWWIKPGTKQNMWNDIAYEIGMIPNTPITTQNLLDLAENYPAGEGAEQKILTSDMGRECRTIKPQIIQQAYPYWQQGLKTPELFLPWQQHFEQAELKGKFIPRTDPRGIHLGLYTNCCQHLNSVGSSCAVHGTQNENGSFFVVEDESGKIVAQSWVWHTYENNKHKLVFDNIELTDKGYSTNIDEMAQDIKTIYDMASEELAKHYHVVLLGATYTLNHLLYGYQKAGKDIKASTEDLEYTDAEHTQYVLKQNPDPEPYPQASTTEITTSIENHHEITQRTTTTIYDHHHGPEASWCADGQKFVDKTGKILYQNPKQSKTNTGVVNDENTYAWIHTVEQLKRGLKEIQAYENTISSAINYQMLDMILHRTETTYGVDMLAAAKIVALKYKNVNEKTIQHLTKHNMLKTLDLKQILRIPTVETFQQTYPDQLDVVYEILEPKYDHIFGKQRQEITYQLGLLKAAGLTADDINQTIQTKGLGQTVETIIWLNPDEYKAWLNSEYTLNDIVDAKQNKLSLNQYKNRHHLQNHLQDETLTKSFLLLLTEANQVQEEDIALAKKLLKTAEGLIDNRPYKFVYDLVGSLDGATKAVLENKMETKNSWEEYLSEALTVVIADQLIKTNLWNTTKELDDEQLQQLMLMGRLLEGKFSSWRGKDPQLLKFHLNTTAFLEKHDKLRYGSIKKTAAGREDFYGRDTKPATIQQLKQAYLDAGWDEQTLNEITPLLFNIADKNFYDTLKPEERIWVGSQLTDIDTWIPNQINLNRQTNPRYCVKKLIDQDEKTILFLLRSGLPEKILKSKAAKHPKSLKPLIAAIKKYPEELQNWKKDRLIKEIIESGAKTENEVGKIVEKWEKEILRRKQNFAEYTQRSSHRKTQSNAGFSR